MENLYSRAPHHPYPATTCCYSSSFFSSTSLTRLASPFFSTITIPHTQHLHTFIVCSPFVARHFVASFKFMGALFALPSYLILELEAEVLGLLRLQFWRHCQSVSESPRISSLIPVSLYISSVSDLNNLFCLHHHRGGQFWKLSGNRNFQGNVLTWQIVHSGRNPSPRIFHMTNTQP